MTAVLTERKGKTITPCFDYVLARKVKDLPSTSSNIITVDFKEEERGMLVGEIVSCGPDCRGFEAGDMVVAPLHWSHQIYFEGKDYILLPQDKIRGKISD